MVWIMGTWIASGPEVTHPGPTRIPTWMKWDFYFQQALGVVLALGFFYWFVVRQWRRAGHLTFDGMFFLAGALLFWQDALLNFTSYFAVWNAHLINFGSWYGHVPGWVAPDGKHFIEAPFGVVWYAFGMFGGVLILNRITRALHERHPRLSNVQLVILTIIVAMPLEGLMEIFYTRQGFYAYTGAQGRFTFFSGHFYQVPAYQILLWTCCWTGMASIRYFRDDKGRSIVQRGVDEIKVGPKGRQMVSFLALCGVLNLLFLVCYNLPYQIITMNGSSWPEDIVKRSYYTQGLCGEGTPYACAGPGVPLPRPNSISVTPDGKIHIPPGTKAPTQTGHIK
jgi:hypothetical protein